MTRFFGRVAPNVEIVLADPVGSVLAEYTRSGKIGVAGSWLVEGIGEDFVPSIADLSRVKKAYSVSDGEALDTIRDLLRREGILAGSSTGTLVSAALQYCREQKSPKTVVTFVCDTGNKYLSKAYNDIWMADQGLAHRPTWGDLRDPSEGAVVTLEPDDTLSVAYARMRIYDVSQLPVMENGRLTGIVDESDLLLAAHRGGGDAFDRRVRDVMSSNVQTIDHRAPIEDLFPILDSGLVAVVADQDGFHGLITRIDVLNYLRKQWALQKMSQQPAET
jgi:cystathionine beta-synthase